MGDDANERKKRKSKEEYRSIVRHYTASKSSLTMYYDKKTMMYSIYAQYHSDNKQGEKRVGYPLLWWWGQDGNIANERFRTFCRELG